jgi:hypothetical protein
MTPSNNVISQTTSGIKPTEPLKTLWHTRKTEVTNTAEYIYEHQLVRESIQKKQKF